MISRVSIRDSAAMSRYVDQAPATVAQFGGYYLVRANTATALEGDWDADPHGGAQVPAQLAAT